MDSHRKAFVIYGDFSKAKSILEGSFQGNFFKAKNKEKLIKIIQGKVNKRNSKRNIKKKRTK